MINLKIIVSGGREFNIRNFLANSVEEFIKIVLCKNQTQLNWYEAIPGTWIQTALIEAIVQLSNEELEEINKSALEDGDEIVLDADKSNQEISEGPKPTEEAPDDNS